MAPFPLVLGYQDLGCRGIVRVQDLVDRFNRQQGLVGRSQHPAIVVSRLMVVEDELQAYMARRKEEITGAA